MTEKTLQKEGENDPQCVRFINKFRQIVYKYAAYQILKEDGEGGAVTELPGYPATAASGTPRGYVYVASTNQGGQANTVGYIFNFVYCIITQDVTSQPTAVVASQPRTLPQVSVVEPKPKTKPAILIFSTVLAIICGIHLCLPAFVCLTPALIFAIVVSCNINCMVQCYGHA